MDDPRLFDEEYLDFIQRVENRENHHPRRYLRDGQNPCEFFSDIEFVKRFRFSKQIVMDTIVPLVAADNNDRRGLPLPPVLKVVIALRFYGSNSFQNVCGDLCHVNQATVSRIVKVVSAQLAEHLLEYVYFPGRQQLQEYHRQFYVNGGFPGVTGCIDCTHIGIRSPGGQFAELYRNRKGYMSLNVQVVSGPNLEILDIVTRWPGSTHDSRIFSNSRVMTRFENRVLPGVLLGDNGYPQLHFLFTPILVPNTVEETRYNVAHKRTRNTVERLFGVWKRRFSCLGHKLRSSLHTTSRVIAAGAVLHNIAVARGEPLPPPPADEEHFMPAVPVANAAPRNNRGVEVRADFIQRNFF
ncbi:putative nuclease HARBI1 [Bacillus rossius redtenbacheri]|uniref:putative nuclease HARBI1 n=1 Tax=Bacillus rossius redtenbacheri TaxID=93214 RepID=UPI002FDCA70B